MAFTSRSGAEQGSSGCAGVIMRQVGRVADGKPPAGRNGSAAGFLTAYGHFLPTYCSCIKPEPKHDHFSS